MESAVSQESQSSSVPPHAGRSTGARAGVDKCQPRRGEHPSRQGFLASRDGAAATEFALVLPILILCLFAITAFASTLFMQNNMVNAAREAVRDIAVQDVDFTGGGVQCDSVTPGMAEEAACDYLQFWGNNFTVTASNDCPTTNPKATVAITTSASDAALIDIFGFFNGKSLDASVTMRQWSPCPP